MVNEIHAKLFEGSSLNPGAMAGSATLSCVAEIVSSFETHHTFGVPKRLALKALQRHFYGQLSRAQR